MSQTRTARRSVPSLLVGTVKNVAWRCASHLSLYGLLPWGLNANWVMVEHRAMPLQNLHSGLVGAKIAMISDLHLGPLVLADHLRQYVDMINEMGVDFVAITGDMILGGKDCARRVARILGELSPRVATVACLGNHDYGIWHPNGFGRIRGLRECLADELTKFGVMVLLNETRIFRHNGGNIQFVGVEDLWTEHYNPRSAFELVDEELPTIALCHNPDAAPDLAAFGAQWVLAGHTHGKSTVTRIDQALYPVEYSHFVAGQYALDRDRWLYVNRGLSMARRVRPNERPEITVMSLRQAPADLVRPTAKSPTRNQSQSPQVSLNI